MQTGKGGPVQGTECGPVCGLASAVSWLKGAKESMGRLEPQAEESGPLTGPDAPLCLQLRGWCC